MQRELSAFTHGSNEEANANNGDQHPRCTRETEFCQLPCFAKDFGVVQRTSKGSNQTNTENKSKITNTVDQEGFHIRKNRGRFVEPKTNQQVRNQAHSFPAEEQLQHVVAHNEH